MRWLLLLALVACGDNNRPQQQDAGITPDGAGARTSCLDKPNDLPRPPTGQLPCELLPPGLVLSP